MSSGIALRRAPRPRARVFTDVSLTVGAVVGVACVVANMFVPGLAFVGVGVAIVAGVSAAVSAWRENARLQTAASEREVEMMHGFNDRLHRERETHSSVLDALEHREKGLRGELTQARAEAGQLRRDLSRLRGDHEALVLEHTELKMAHEELLAVTSLDAGDVVALPRRRVVDGDEVIWEEAPTVANLNLQRLVAPFVEEAMRQAN